MMPPISTPPARSRALRWRPGPPSRYRLATARLLDRVGVLAIRSSLLIGSDGVAGNGKVPAAREDARLALVGVELGVEMKGVGRGAQGGAGADAHAPAPAGELGHALGLGPRRQRIVGRDAVELVAEPTAVERDVVQMRGTQVAHGAHLDEAAFAIVPDLDPPATQGGADLAVGRWRSLGRSEWAQRGIGGIGRPHGKI